MTDLRRKEIFDLLDKSERSVLKVIEEASEALFQKKIDDTCWSMAELMEHIIMVETGIIGNIQISGAMPSIEPIVSELEDSVIVSVISDRNRKVQAPEYFEPKGVFANKEMAIKAFCSHRKDIKYFIMSTELSLKNIGFPHFEVGMLNGESWLLFIVGHCERHAEQMAEIDVR